VFENVPGERYEKAPLEALLTMVDHPNQVHLCLSLIG
jgi:hypothetical protein